jgi:hypothetical protein
MSQRLHIDGSGRLRGPASISYNSPFPCPNGQDGGMSVPQGIMGVVMHTMVGNLAGTIASFNDPSFQASAHFGIDQDGNIHQFGPVSGWMAWAEANGNTSWYSIEHADGGDPDVALTDAQLTASAQVVEALAVTGNFPLHVSDSPGQEGFGVHSMGGADWGGHTCPDLPPRHVRSSQRPEILRRAAAIRAGQPLPGAGRTAVTDGTTSLAVFAASHGSSAAPVLRATAEAGAGGEFVPALASYVNTVFATDTAPLPANVVLHYQHKNSNGQWQLLSWKTGQEPGPLHAVAAHLGTDSESIIRLTAEHNVGGVFDGAEFTYINGVFTRSTVPLPAGLTLHLG